MQVIGGLDVEGTEDTRRGTEMGRKGAFAEQETTGTNDTLA